MKAWKILRIIALGCCGLFIVLYVLCGHEVLQEGMQQAYRIVPSRGILFLLLAALALIIAGVLSIVGTRYEDGQQVEQCIKGNSRLVFERLLAVWHRIRPKKQGEANQMDAEATETVQPEEAPVEGEPSETVQPEEDQREANQTEANQTEEDQTEEDQMDKDQVDVEYVEEELSEDAYEEGNQEAEYVEGSSMKVTPIRNIGGRKYIKYLVLLAILTILILLAYNKPTIYLDPYVTVHYEGYHKYGQAHVEIDWEGLEQEYQARTNWLTKKLPIYVKNTIAGMEEDTAEDSAEGTVEGTAEGTAEGEPAAGTKEGKKEEVSVLEILKTEVSVQVTPSTDLENEEHIQLEPVFNAETLKKILKCNLEFRQKRRIVKGLEVVDTFNPFSDVTISFHGINGRGEAVVYNNGEVLETEGNYEFHIENNTKLYNGDVVKVTLTISDVEDFVTRYKCLPILTEAEYTVAGLDTYICSPDEMDDNTREQLQAHAVQDINEYVQTLSRVEGFSMQYLGDYVCVEDAPLVLENIYGMVYKVELTMSGDGSEYPTQITSYYDIRFPDVVKLHKGGYDLEVERRQFPTEQFVKMVQQEKKFYEFFKPKHVEQYFQGFETLIQLQEKRQQDFAVPTSISWNVIEL